MNLHIKKKIISICMAFALAFSLPIGSYNVHAASYTLTAEEGVLLTCNGTEVFSDADASTYVTTLSANIPVQVTGSTSNGFWQVNIDGNTFYVSRHALSIYNDTYAYHLTDFDVRAALVANATNGNIIYSQDSFDRLEPASTTKILTALIVLEAIGSGQISLETPVVVSAAALSSVPADASHMNPKLKAGEVLTISDLLTAMMVSSDCYASNVLAEAVSGTVDDFVALMNARATQLGCVDSNFTNPSGYPDKNMYTNAYSLYLITLNAINNSIFNQCFGLNNAVIPATNLCSTPRLLSNSDLMMNQSSVYYNPYVLGGKTGTTNNAGQCLVTVASKDGKLIITVVLGGRNRKMFDGNTVSMRYAETNRLIELGFANYN